MKTFEAINKEIKKTREAMTTSAEKQAAIERVAFREAYANGDEEQRAEARAQYDAALEAYAKEQERNNDLKIAIQLLTENAKNAFFAENIGKICEIWNAYVGKSCGEKTYNKIRDEIRDAIGCYVSICNQYRNARITIYFNLQTGTPFRDIEIAPIWDANNDRPAIDNNNKILSLDPETLKICYCGAYVDNIPAHIKALKKAHQKAREAFEAYQDATSKYNDLTRGNIPHISTREGVNKWII